MCQQREQNINIVIKHYKKQDISDKRISSLRGQNKYKFTLFLTGKTTKNKVWKTKRPSSTKWGNIHTTNYKAQLLNNYLRTKRKEAQRKCTCKCSIFFTSHHLPHILHVEGKKINFQSYWVLKVHPFFLSYNVNSEAIAQSFRLSPPPPSFLTRLREPRRGAQGQPAPSAVLWLLSALQISKAQGSPMWKVTLPALQGLVASPSLSLEYKRSSVCHLLRDSPGAQGTHL